MAPYKCVSTDRLTDWEKWSTDVDQAIAYSLDHFQNIYCDDDDDDVYISCHCMYRVTIKLQDNERCFYVSPCLVTQLFNTDTPVDTYHQLLSKSLFPSKRTTDQLLAAMS